MICCLVRDAGAAHTAPLTPGALEDIARACSPRVESHGDRAVIFDAAGLARVIGAPADIARDVEALARERGVAVRVALAASTVAAWLLAHARPGVTVIAPDRTSAALAVLPIAALATLPGSSGPRRRAIAEALTTLERWGMQTLGQVARLPRADVRTRLGVEGVRLHQAACGEDAAPLVPVDVAVPFLERCVLDWPIEGLEPLTFVLARLCDALSRSLEHADRGAVAVTTQLRLVTRETHTRTLRLPAAMRESKVLRTLIVLDLESHPPSAGIDTVTVGVEVAPGRIVQGSLLDRALPSPEQLATLTARLGALVGDTRVGAPLVPDSHDGRGAALRAFAAVPRREPPAATLEAAPRTVLRRFRLPIPARVIVERGGPVRVIPVSSVVPAGRVVERAGPWRTSGRWWATDRNWDRDEWDVELASGGCYRLARHRATGHWEIEGEID